jgi:hypothetical protein
MARLPRYVIPGQPQHIIQRGNNRQVIFAADALPRTSIRVRRILGGLTGDRLRTPFILPILIPGMPLMVDICRGIHQVIHYRIGNIKNLLLRHFLEIHFRVVNSTNRI